MPYLVPMLLHATLGSGRECLLLYRLAGAPGRLSGLSDLSDLSPAVSCVSHLLKALLLSRGPRRICSALLGRRRGYRSTGLLLSWNCRRGYGSDLLHRGRRRRGDRCRCRHRRGSRRSRNRSRLGSRNRGGRIGHRCMRLLVRLLVRLRMRLLVRSGTLTTARRGWCRSRRRGRLLRGRDRRLRDGHRGRDRGRMVLLSLMR